MGWKPFCIGLLFGLFGATLAIGLYSCGGATSTPPVAATATPPPLSVEQVLQAYRDVGLAIEIGSQDLAYPCTQKPGLLRAQPFGSNVLNRSAYVLAVYDSAAHAEDARASCTNQLTDALRRDAVVLVLARTTEPGSHVYFTVLLNAR